MSERKPCIRCGRSIDGYAKICPYCNWDQADFAPPPEAEAAVAAPAADYTPPDETRKLKRRLLYGAGGIVLLIACFYIGIAINRDGAPKVPVEASQPTATVEGAVKPPPSANVTLVPVTGADAEVETPITSAPVTNAPGSLTRSTPPGSVSIHVPRP